jgi:hypothetical protein
VVQYAVIGVKTTELISRHHGFRPLKYAEEHAVCTFCGAEEYGKPSNEVINHDYFTDYDLADDTGHVCAPCAMCMSEEREFKNGSWLATPNEYLSFSTGDIKQVIRDVTNGEYETPLALHVAEAPMRSEHAYLWTPVSHSTDPVTVDFSRQTIRVEQETFFDLIDAVETLRGHGFRLDDLRHDSARISDIKSAGREQYRRLRDEIEPYRQTSLFELVLKASERP